MCASAPILEAAHSPKWLGRQLSRIAAHAHLHPFRTTRCEPASDANVRQIGGLAINDRKSHAAGSCVPQVPLRKTYQSLCVGMKRSTKNICCLTLFKHSDGILIDAVDWKTRQ